MFCDYLISLQITKAFRRNCESQLEHDWRQQKNRLLRNLRHNFTEGGAAPVTVSFIILCIFFILTLFFLVFILVLFVINLYLDFLLAAFVGNVVWLGQRWSKDVIFVAFNPRDSCETRNLDSFCRQRANLCSSGREDCHSQRKCFAAVLSSLEIHWRIPSCRISYLILCYFDLYHRIGFNQWFVLILVCLPVGHWPFHQSFF